MFDLSKNQLLILKAFYAHDFTKVVLTKVETEAIWDLYIMEGKISEVYDVAVRVPAISAEIEKSKASGRHVQSAVFSECVYAQTLANMFKLSAFINCSKEKLPLKIVSVLKKNGMVARYAYTDGTYYLVQAGGCGSIDGVIISILDESIFRIEFKEIGAKTSEPDLPKYGEDGNIVVTDEFLEKNPQFEAMLKEQKNFNFFNHMGHNENNFTYDSIMKAVDETYSESYKLADVICTVDKDNYLVMIPANKLAEWATKIEGEIRPAGRNPYSVWTPQKLGGFLDDKKAVVRNGMVTLPRSELIPVRQRGGRDVGRYKINSLFFVRVTDCSFVDEMAQFKLDKIRQLNPTISAKVFFNKLSIKNLFEKYSQII